MAIWPGRSESCFEVEVEPPLFARIQPAGHVEADDSVKHGLPITDTAQRTADPRRFVSIPDPSKVAKDPGSVARFVAGQLEASQPERVPALCDVGALAANGVSAAQIPEAVHRKSTDRAAGGERDTDSGPERRAFGHGGLAGGAPVERVS